MPHLHLETTADLPENADIPDILEALCNELIEQMKVDPTKTRAYHTLRSVWHVGAGAPPAFVHLTVAVLDGRDATWRHQVAQSMHAVLLTHFHMSIEAEETSVTVEVREMESASYARLP